MNMHQEFLGITQGASQPYSYEEVVTQLTNMVGKFRLGRLRENTDGDIYNYRKTSTSPFDRIVEIQSGVIPGRLPGAQGLEYYVKDENGNEVALKEAVTLYDTLKTEPNLSRVRHVVFHEWTHAMEKTIRQTDDAEILTDVVQGDEQKRKFYEHYLSDGKVFLNQGRQFLNSEKLENGLGILHTGLATREIVPVSEQRPEGIAMHNQITEGWVEKIAREVMKHLGLEHEIDFGKYRKHTRVAEQVMEAEGKTENITQFLRDSAVLIERYERTNIDGRDGLHHLAEYVDKGPNLPSESLFPAVAERLNLTPEQVERLTCLKIWSETELTEASISELKKIFFENLENVDFATASNANTDINNILESYKSDLSNERELVGRFVTALEKQESKKVVTTPIGTEPDDDSER